MAFLGGIHLFGENAKEAIGTEWMKPTLKLEGYKKKLC